MKLIIGKEKFKRPYCDDCYYVVKRVLTSLNDYKKEGVKDKSAQVMLSKAIKNKTEYDGLYWSYEECDEEIFLLLFNMFCDSSLRWIHGDDKVINFKVFYRCADILNAFKDYKQFMKDMQSCGVYGIFKNNELVYIGSSDCVIGRIHQHFEIKKDDWHADLRKNYNNYTWCILEKCTKETRFEKEKEYIKKFAPKYNIKHNT